MQSFPPGCSLPPTYRVVCRRPERHHRLLRPSGSLRGGALPPRDMRHARAIRRGVRRDAEGSGRRRRLVHQWRQNDRRLVHIHGNEHQHRHEHHAGREEGGCRSPDIGEGRSAGEWDPRRSRERREAQKGLLLPSIISHCPLRPMPAASTEKPASNNPSRRSKPNMEPKASRQPTDRPCAHVQNQLSCSFQIRCGRSDRAIDAPADSRHSF